MQFEIGKLNEQRDDLSVMSIERLLGKSENRLTKSKRLHSVLN